MKLNHHRNFGSDAKSKVFTRGRTQTINLIDNFILTHNFKNFVSTDFEKKQIYKRIPALGSKQENNEYHKQQTTKLFARLTKNKKLPNL